MTEERIRALEARLSGASKAQPPQAESGAASPDDQYVVVGNAPSESGSGRDIDLKTTAGETVLQMDSGARYGFQAYWSEDSEHLIVIIPGRFNGQRNDTMGMAEKVYGKWESVGYTIPLAQGSEITFLNWVSPVQRDCGGATGLSPCLFGSPLNLCFGWAAFPT